MIFSITKLEDKISKNEFTDDEGFKYLLYGSIYGILTELIYNVFNINYISGLGSFFSLVSVAIALIYSYKINKKSDGRDFFKRYISISFITTLILILPGLLFWFISLNFWDITNPSVFAQFFVISSSLIMNTLYSVLIINSFKRIKKKIEGN